MNRNFVLGVFGLIVGIWILFVLPMRVALDAKVLHYVGNNKVTGCLFVEYPDANGQIIKNEKACKIFSQKELLSMEAIQHEK